MKTRTLAMLTTVMALSLSACGGNSVQTAPENTESNTEETSEETGTPASESTSETVSETPASDEAAPETTSAYTPATEIMNADFHSGLIQIGDDIFHNGGYYTVNQFIEQFGDKYDMSAIDTDAILATDMDSISLPSQTDPNLSIMINYAPLHFANGGNDNNETVGEAVVYLVLLSPDAQSAPVWFPTGIEMKNTDWDSEGVEQFCESIGLKKVDDINDSKYRRVYGAYGLFNSHGTDLYAFNTDGTKENLYGEYPYYMYRIWKDGDYTCINMLNLEYRNTTNAWKSVSEAE